MSFWSWAVAAYARPGVAPACLALQDEHGQCVPFLLWAAWAAWEGRRLGPVELGAGAGLANRWEAVAVVPLRAVRRGLKPPVEGLMPADQEALRRQVKAVELEAERLLIQALEAGSPRPGPAPLPVEPALLAAGRAWRTRPTEEALARLAQTLS